MATETDICNRALSQIGAKRITSLDEDSEEARACKVQYPLERDLLLRRHPWNFAIRRAALTRLSSTPIFGWSYEYELPVDLIRVITFNGREVGVTQDDFEIEGSTSNGKRILLCDADEAKIRYVARIRDTSQFDPAFADDLAMSLAVSIIPRLKDGDEVALAQLREIVEKRDHTAKTVDARESRGRRKAKLIPWDSPMDAQRRGGIFSNGSASSGGTSGSSNGGSGTVSWENITGKPTLMTLVDTKPSSPTASGNAGEYYVEGEDLYVYADDISRWVQHSGAAVWV